MSLCYIFYIQQFVFLIFNYKKLRARWPFSSDFQVLDEIVFQHPGNLEIFLRIQATDTLYGGVNTSVPVATHHEVCLCSQVDEHYLWGFNFDNIQRVLKHTSLLNKDFLSHTFSVH